MSDSLGEEVQQAFAKMTRAPRPYLNERLRESIWGRPAPATLVPPSSTPWVGPILNPAPGRSRKAPRAVLVAVVLVISLATVALLAGPGGLVHQVAALRTALGSRSPTAATAARPATSAAPPASAAPTASAPASEPSANATPAAGNPTSQAGAPAPLPGYSCAGQRGGASGQSTMTTARGGPQSGYDRFVVQFSGDVPQFEVRPQDSAAFAQAGLLGSAGLTVTLMNTTAGGGPTDLRLGLRMIQEAKILSSSGGTVQWGIGLARVSCFHAFILPSPSRLVVDVQF
jgi:hypothetical protein